MGGHQSSRMISCEWLTPREIITALGDFDLDPCSPECRPWDTAKVHYSRKDDGFVKPWAGRVWLNPPYGHDTWKWLKKLSEHGNGIALIFARTETVQFFRTVWDKADSIFFFLGRLTFHRADGRRAMSDSGAPSCLVAYGQNNTTAISISGLRGKLIILKGPSNG